MKLLWNSFNVDISNSIDWKLDIIIYKPKENYDMNFEAANCKQNILLMFDDIL